MSQMDGSVSATAEDLDEGSRLIEGMASQSLHTNAFPHYEATGSQYGRRYEIRCEGGNYDNSYQSYGASNFGWWCCVETHWAVSPAIAKGTERKARLVADFGYQEAGSANGLSNNGSSRR